MVKVFDNPFYYLDNFQLVLDWIDARYADLLSTDERLFIEHFGALPQASRALLVRMVMRKGALFRTSKLSYAEIGDTREAARPLLALGWIARDPLLTLDQLFDLLHKGEIGALFRLPPHERGARKAAQLAALRAHYPEARPFSAWFADAGEQAYEALCKPLCERLRLIFFGNFHQDWSEFVLSDLGIYRYETVDFSPSSRGFRSRRDIDDYLALQRCRERFAGGEPAAAVLAGLAAGPCANEWLDSRRNRLLFQIGQQLEKDGDWPGAHAVYAICRYPGARARAIRVLEKDGRHGPALTALEAASLAPESEAERQQLSRMAPRLRRRLGQPPQATPPAAPVRRLDLALAQPAMPCSVEEVARAHLARPGAPVYYVENALINALFGLLCWSAVFQPIPGAFFHPFHRGPADLHSADFLQRRAAAFGRCLAELDSGQYRATIRANYAAKHGLQSPFVAWEGIGEELLGLALDCIPAAHLKQWFARMLEDVKANCSGFPDLIQFWPAERRYDMIEVKGPGDRLQDSQKRWIAYCAERGMPVAVCYLQWREDGA